MAQVVPFIWDYLLIGTVIIHALFWSLSKYKAKPASKCQSILTEVSISMQRKDRNGDVLAMQEPRTRIVGSKPEDDSIAANSCHDVPSNRVVGVNLIRTSRLDHIERMSMQMEGMGDGNGGHVQFNSMSMSFFNRIRCSEGMKSDGSLAPFRI